MKALHIYSAQLSFPKISSDELLKAARTLVGKPIVFDMRVLSRVENFVFAEYLSDKSVEIVLFAKDMELISLSDKGTLLYVMAKYQMVQPGFLKHPRLLFSNLVISSDIIPSGSSLKKIQEVGDMPEWLPPSYFYEMPDDWLHYGK